VRGRRPLKGLGDRALKAIGEGVRGRMAGGVVSRGLSSVVSTPLSSVVSRGLLTARATRPTPPPPRVYAPASAAPPPSPWVPVVPVASPVAPVASGLLVRLAVVLALLLLLPPRCAWFASRASCQNLTLLISGGRRLLSYSLWLTLLSGSASNVGCGWA
jgi:hypothetical protein